MRSENKALLHKVPDDHNKRAYQKQPKGITDDFRSTSFPGGNQVDGLPPALHIRLHTFWEPVNL